MATPLESVLFRQQTATMAKSAFPSRSNAGTNHGAKVAPDAGACVSPRIWLEGRGAFSLEGSHAAASSGNAAALAKGNRFCSSASSASARTTQGDGRGGDFFPFEGLGLAAASKGASPQRSNPTSDWAAWRIIISLDPARHLAAGVAGCIDSRKPLEEAASWKVFYKLRSQALVNGGSTGYPGVRCMVARPSISGRVASVVEEYSESDSALPSVECADVPNPCV